MTRYLRSVNTTQENKKRKAVHKTIVSHFVDDKKDKHHVYRNALWL